MSTCPFFGFTFKVYIYMSPFLLFFEYMYMFIGSACLLTVCFSEDTTYVLNVFGQVHLRGVGFVGRAVVFAGPAVILGLRLVLDQQRTEASVMDQQLVWVPAGVSARLAVQ